MIRNSLDIRVVLLDASHTVTNCLVISFKTATTLQL